MSAVLWGQRQRPLPSRVVMQAAVLLAAVAPSLGEFEAGLGVHRIPYQIILDRSAAIRQAIAGARPGDVVLIAGKGHEPYQIFGTTKRPFDDRVEARASLALRRGESRA